MGYTGAMATDPLAPQQQRSREMLARLLKATIAVLEQHGLSGATIPRVAAAAGVAPASVYRRFRDRDALYRAAFLEALETSAEADPPREWPTGPEILTLDDAVAAIVAVLSRSYREHPGLLRAVVRFIETDSDLAFRQRALELVAKNYRRASDALLRFRDQIAHADAERATLFGLLTVVTALEVRTFEEVSMWRELLPISDREMQAELVKTLLAYLRSP